MLSKEQIVSISLKRLGRKPVGCERLKDLKRVVLYFEVPEKSEDVPANGGASFIDEETEEIGFITLLEMLEYEGESEDIDIRTVQIQKAS